MMSMLNQAAVEALCSATYLENYLDCMENLPDDLQRVVSQLRELDSTTKGVMQDIGIHRDVFLKESDGPKRHRALLNIQRGLIQSQELWDEKLNLSGLIIEHIEGRTRQLDQDLENLDPASVEVKDEKPIKANDVKSTKLHHQNILSSVPKTPPTIIPRVPLDLPITPSSPATSAVGQAAAIKGSSGAGPLLTPPSSANAVSPSDIKGESSGGGGGGGSSSVTQHNKVKRQRRQRTHQEATSKEEKKEEEEKQQPKKKKKRKAKNTNKNFEKTLVGEPIDPDEPLYCICEQVSYGDMICCDYDSCTMEWFHFNCVSLTTKPKGKWYCPKCRGDRMNVKRPDLK